MRHVCAVLIVVAFAQQAFSGETSVIHDVRYNIAGERSRVTLSFRGAVRYAAEKNENVIVLRFANTRVSSPPGAARLNFASGGVRRLVIDRRAQEEVTVTLTLREDAHTSYSPSESGDRLYVDVIRKAKEPGDAPRSSLSTYRMQKARTSSTTPVAAHRIGTPTTGRTMIGGDARAKNDHTPLIDIAKIARMPDAPVASDPKLGTARIHPGRSHGETILAIMISIVCALIGTGAIVFFLSRRIRSMRRVPHGPAYAHPVRAEISLPLKAAFTSQEHPVRVPEAGREKNDLPADEETLYLAERFRRSRGDLDLAVQVSSGSYGRRVTKMIDHTKHDTLTDKQRMTMAKKLGVGMGELDLMTHLGQVKGSHEVKEERR